MEISDKSLPWSLSKCELLAVRNKSSRGKKGRNTFGRLWTTTKLSTFTNEENSGTAGFSPMLPSFETIWEHQDLPAESNEVVRPTFHCEENLGRSQVSLLHAGGSCCLPVARWCHWGGPGAPLGWCACCSPWRSWQVPNGFRRGCFQSGHYSSWRAATRKGEEEKGVWQGALGANTGEQKVSQGKKGLSCCSGCAA